jgi:hypothetical protein
MLSGYRQFVAKLGMGERDQRVQIYYRFACLDHGE